MGEVEEILHNLVVWLVVWLSKATGVSFGLYNLLFSSLACIAFLWSLRWLILKLVWWQTEDLQVRYQWRRISSYADELSNGTISVNLTKKDCDVWNRLCSGVLRNSPYHQTTQSFFRQFDRVSSRTSVPLMLRRVILVSITTEIDALHIMYFAI